MKQFLLCPFISANDAALSLPVKGADASAVANHKRVLTVFPQTSLLSRSRIIKAYPSYKGMVWCKPRWHCNIQASSHFIRGTGPKKVLSIWTTNMHCPTPRYGTCKFPACYWLRASSISQKWITQLSFQPSPRTPLYLDLHTCTCPTKWSVHWS